MSIYPRSLAHLATDITRPVLHAAWGYGTGLIGLRAVVPLLLMADVTEPEDEAA